MSVDWLRAVLEDSRGFGLGTSDPSVLAITMKKQSVKWTSLAKGYISDGIVIAHTFICELLELLCPNERVRAGLSSTLADSLLDKYGKAQDFVDFLLTVERSGPPMTSNHYFNDNIRKQ